uniref:Thioredoxin domain-containing protein n=1 Tax=Rhizochromulina marina TaxID=1034831 RepID=A0A7S2RT04_9STRA|mmetsp:Transcript_20091/g.58761  ORF Transcript_20091/g.58761 Transcript_20091/m.58761 type:complete len:248 (+) Transcript_20091:132-875(+)|eukprot:CAMPEP_0118967104 /NCGR_PEP_ID=MMETSP1173-20130426/4518_1 /TAXON_ID=1034831 /ORGANISM="Rhizochromulina marina cf, Strain CCMP1243" /LENGTH=247 /DNA_ID=CAMNT_0006916005 /DNA_START=64 /DNA_END=807 /DNA_ORIENTATION=+
MARILPFVRFVLFLSTVKFTDGLQPWLGQGRVGRGPGSALRSLSTEDTLRGWGVPLIGNDKVPCVSRIQHVDGNDVGEILSCHFEPSKEAFLVFFHSKNCGPCILLKAELEKLLPELSAMNVLVRCADVSNEQDLLRVATATAGWPLRALPCLVLFHEGVPVDRLEAPSSSGELIPFISSNSHRWLNPREEEEEIDTGNSDRKQQRAVARGPRTNSHPTSLSWVSVFGHDFLKGNWWALGSKKQRNI